MFPVIALAGVIRQRGRHDSSKLSGDFRMILFQIFGNLSAAARNVPRRDQQIAISGLQY
jgi:hypothetical protein